MNHAAATDAADRALLLQRAQEIRALLEGNAEQTDALRRLPDANVRALKETGLSRLMVPRRFGGCQTSVRTYIEAMAALGQESFTVVWSRTWARRKRDGASAWE